MRVVVALLLAIAPLSAACGPTVNCENLCARTMVCQVTFAPSDDLEGEKIDSGERTAAESCALGCADQPAVTLESAACVDEATDASQEPAVCQDTVLACFGADVAQAQ
ncbi:MAG: hypothetical protein A2138_10910 [Deltaproteobacteria bacterium RBG_16_71_12]|nr:MAG: hypothetical protein A2138_10910 [Deltaproteobacteria bacterium RBG_16_71_12]